MADNKTFKPSNLTSKLLVFATQNQHKVEEIRNLLPKQFLIKTLQDYNFTKEIPETKTDLVGNALQKARFIFEEFKTNCFADDTGLEVEALNNSPGVHSARYAGNEKDSEKNIDLLLKNLSGISNRNARFKTVIALIFNGKEYLFEGVVKGKILLNRRGTNGFGYDPIFEPENCGKSFAEMSLNEKNKFSHRSRAIHLLFEFLKSK